jgi:Uncharacterized conserved protein
MILVSACLAGIYSKYNGGTSCVNEIVELISKGEAIPVCPEQLGGCSTPRPPVELYGGSGGEVLDGRCSAIRKNGEDVSELLIKGAEEVLKIAEMAGAKKAILKARSPSCGCGKIYDGTFTGRIIKGNGVTSELLIRNGIEVKTEED